MDIYKSLDVQQREVGKKSTVKNLIKNGLNTLGVNVIERM